MKSRYYLKGKPPRLFITKDGTQYYIEVLGNEAWFGLGNDNIKRLADNDEAEFIISNLEDNLKGGEWVEVDKRPTFDAIICEREDP